MQLTVLVTAISYWLAEPRVHVLLMFAVDISLQICQKVLWPFCLANILHPKGIGFTISGVQNNDVPNIQRERIWSMGGDTSHILAAPWEVSQGRNHRHDRWISWEAGEWGETASFTEDIKMMYRYHTEYMRWEVKNKVNWREYCERLENWGSLSRKIGINVFSVRCFALWTQVKHENKSEICSGKIWIRLIWIQKFKNYKINSKFYWEN